MTTGSSNELMQEGIRHVREGHMADAYLVFKQVIERDPRNEFAQIWISVTSEDRAEKRASLEKALEINPNSQHAKEALRVLNAEESRLNPKTGPLTQDTVPLRAPAPTAPLSVGETSSKPPRTGEREQPSQPGRIGSQEFVSNPFRDMPVQIPPARPGVGTQETKPNKLGQAENQTNPPRLGSREINTTPRLEEKLPPASLVSTPATNGKKSSRPKAGVDPVTAADRAANTPQKRERLFLRRIRLTGFFILATLVVLLSAFLVYNLLQNQANQQQAAQTVQGTATPTGSAAESPAASTPQTPAAATSPTLIQLSPAAGTPASTTPGPSTAASTQAATAASTQALAARNLQAARDSQASGDYKGAISAYQAVLKADASNVSANLGLGTLYLNAPDSAIPGQVNRYAEAAQSFRTVANQNPNWAGGYSHLGQALALQGNIKEAISAYSRSLELDPNGPERWLALAALYEKDNQPEQARYCRERSGSLSQTSPVTPPTTTAVPVTTPPPTTPA
ncbi:MAG: hypothetical protein JWP00_3625 [Chloroflexi bacterium]|nr:hypothetical protein [Chloroflexota bacterium]